MSVLKNISKETDNTCGFLSLKKIEAVITKITDFESLTADFSVSNYKNDLLLKKLFLKNIYKNVFF